MSSSTTRFSYTPSKFVPQLDTLDNLQLLPGIPPNLKKYLDWHWSQAESDKVTDFRTKADDLWAQIGKKRNCPPGVNDDMKILIRDFMAYDHGKTDPHHLLDKIAAFGSADDCRTAGILRGTPMAKQPSHGGETPVEEKILIPVVYLRDNPPNQQLLALRPKDNPKSRALPEGIKFCKVYRAIGPEPPANIIQFIDIGNAKRGLFLSKFNGLNLDPKAKLYAYYIARYETTTGELLEPSAVLEVEIFITSA